MEKFSLTDSLTYRQTTPNSLSDLDDDGDIEDLGDNNDSFCPWKPFQPSSYHLSTEACWKAI